MTTKKLPVAPGTLLRMEWGTDAIGGEYAHAGLGAGADGGFLVTALGGGEILAPTYGGAMRTYSGITFWEPGAVGGRPYGVTAEGHCTATFRGDDESWFYIEVLSAT